MNSDIKYLGIDLGTTNSAVAIFVDGEVKTLLNTRGEVNTPSVVRVTPNAIVVGSKAKKHLHSDFANTFKEFKRLMGTESLSKADRNGHCWSAQALSAELLKFLRTLADEQAQCNFDKVVITVPALFELPQSKATAEAARMAGFDKVELLPGTFDASLLESRDGLLRVVGHDGDNFLGGRDIDSTIVSWIKEQLQEKHSLSLLPEHGDYKQAIRHLEDAAETAKIRLSSTTQSVIELEFEYDDEDYEFDLGFSRETLKTLCAPLIQRSIDICKRLLKTQGLDLEHLQRVVLVGGPAHMPLIRDLVGEQLAPLAESGEDPMSLVSQGAAIYAATINLACSSEKEASSTSQSYQVWLQYPSVCTELNPAIMGRIIDKSVQAHAVKLTNTQKTWESPLIEIDDSGIFIVEASVKAGSKNTFEITAFNQQQNIISLAHQPINIVHGLTMSDPPLSRSIGLALADGSVKQFIERGTPLPAKRSFIQSTIDTLVNDASHVFVVKSAVW